MTKVINTTQDNNNLPLYNLELAKIEFQNNLSALLEIQAKWSEKITYCNTTKKDVAFFNVTELEIYTKHLLDVVSGLAGNYDTLNNTSKLLIFSNRILEKEVENTFKPESKTL